MFKKFIYSSVMFAPIVIFAQNDKGSLQSFTEMIKGVVDTLIPIAFGLAIAAFFFGIAKYLFNSGDDAKSEGRRIMIQGTIAIVLMLSIFGIAQFFQTSLGVNNNADTTQFIPSIGG